MPQRGTPHRRHLRSPMLVDMDAALTARLDGLDRVLGAQRARIDQWLRSWEDRAKRRRAQRLAAAEEQWSTRGRVAGYCGMGSRPSGD